VLSRLTGDRQGKCNSYRETALFPNNIELALQLLLDIDAD
jgi:hypothetical protein